MDKEESIKQIRDYLFKIRTIAREFGTGDYLSLGIAERNGVNCMSFNNENWERGEHGSDGRGIDYFETFEEE